MDANAHTRGRREGYILGGVDANAHTRGRREGYILGWVDANARTRGRRESYILGWVDANARTRGRGSFHRRDREVHPGLEKDRRRVEGCVGDLEYLLAVQ